MSDFAEINAVLAYLNATTGYLRQCLRLNVVPAFAASAHVVHSLQMRLRTLRATWHEGELTDQIDRALRGSSDVINRILQMPLVRSPVQRLTQSAEPSASPPSAPVSTPLSQQ